MISLPEKITGEKKRVGLYLLVDIHETLKEVSEETGFPMSEIVCLVMREWLREEGYFDEADADTESEAEEKEGQE